MEEIAWAGTPDTGVSDTVDRLIRASTLVRIRVTRYRTLQVKISVDVAVTSLRAVTGQHPYARGIPSRVNKMPGNIHQSTTHTAIAAAVFAMLLAGCGGGDTDSAATAAAADAPAGAAAAPAQTTTATGTSSVASGTSNSSIANTPAAMPKIAAVAGASTGTVVAGVEYFGRFDFSQAAGPRFAWSGSAIKARFNGPSVAAKFKNSGGAVNFTVVIDDGAPVVIKSTAGSNSSFTLASGLQSGEHTVLLTRNSEAYDGTVQFLGFDFGGGSVLSPASTTKGPSIEVYGDSISAGVGNVRTNCSGYSVDDESAYLTYAAKASRTLGSQPPTIIAWSGKGIYHNGAGAAANVDTIPQTYDRAVGNEKLIWNFPADKAPEVVVVALGTNDVASLPSGGRPSDAVLTDAYVSFGKTLRAKYPQANLIFGVGPMNYVYQPAVLTAVSQMVSGGDGKVSSLIFSQSKQPFGCDSHPSEATHTAMGNELVAAVKKLGF
jgi:lysophospholipase L1-like esterase